MQRREEWPFPLAQSQAQTSTQKPQAFCCPSAALAKPSSCEPSLLRSCHGDLLRGRVPLLIANVVRERSRREDVPKKNSDALHSAAVPLSLASVYPLMLVECARAH